MRKSAAIILCGLVAVIVAQTPRVNAQDNGESIATRRDKAKQCRRLLKHALQNIEIGALDSAQVDLDSALLCDPRNPDIYYHQGFIHASRGDTLRAVETMTEGVAQAPLSSRLKIGLARLHLERGEYNSAVELLDAVLAFKPRECEALYLKGLLHLNRSDTAAAVNQFQKALEKALE